MKTFHEDEETSSVLWEFLIANLMQKIEVELDGFWAGPFVS